MKPLPPTFGEAIFDATGASSFAIRETVQELWSGYGKILRVSVDGANRESIIVKHIAAPSARSHPRGWNSNLSHERKLQSYEVEMRWYQNWSARGKERFRTPQFLGLKKEGDEVLLILEDLDASGFPERSSQATDSQIEACLRWLAEFHATFLGVKPDGLWEVGTYWHLATRPEELEALDDSALREAAPRLDAILSSAQYQTLVHGDAKLANFCFSVDTNAVAGLDFQYVGGGCGMKDVAYFIGSCLGETECEQREKMLLDYYFSRLRQSLTEQESAIDLDEIESEWRDLFPVAWTDFHRFLKGWCPGHWKINSYSERISREVLRGL